MVRGALTRLAARAAVLAALLVLTPISARVDAQGAIPPPWRGENPVASGGNARPGDITGQPGVVPIDNGGNPIVSPPLVLGTPTTPNQIVGVVHHRLAGGARVPFPFVLPTGATVDTARQLGLVSTPGGPIEAIGLNRIVGLPSPDRHRRGNRLPLPAWADR